MTEIKLGSMKPEKKEDTPAPKPAKEVKKEPPKDSNEGPPQSIALPLAQIAPEKPVQSATDLTEDPWFKIKLYYILDSQRFDQWEDYQNKMNLKSPAPGDPVPQSLVRRLLNKQIREITPEEKSSLAALAFRAALEQKEESIMCDILRIESIIDLQVQDLCEVVNRDCFAVLKAIVDKPVAISRDIKRLFQSSMYHKTERILGILGESVEAQYLEAGDIIDYMVSKNLSDPKIATLISFLDNRKDKTALRSLLVHHRERLAERLCREKIIEPTDEAVLVSVEFKCFHFLLAYMRITNYELSDESVASALYAKVAKLIGSDIPHMEVYLYILRKYQSGMPYSAAKTFVEILNDWIHSSELMVAFVKGTVNPLKLCILMLELLNIVSKMHKNLAKWAQDNSEDITNLAVSLMNEISEELDLHTILTDPDLDGRSTIEIASCNGFLDIFKHKSITTVTEKIWSGPYLSNSDPISECSMLFANLKHNPVSRLDFFKRNYVKSFDRDYLGFGTHNYQFVTWRDGFKCRYLMESVYYLAFFVYIYIVFYNAVHAIRGGYDIYRTRQENQESPTRQEVLDIFSYLRDMYTCMQIGHYLFLYLVILSLRHIPMAAFGFLTKRSLWPLAYEIFLDLADDVVIIVYFFNAYDQVSGIGDYLKNKALFITKTVDLSDNNPWTIPLDTLAVICSFFRALNVFEVHSVIGPFVKMIKQMAAKMANFGLLFLVLLIMFAMVSYIFNPYEIDIYRDVYRSAISLFQASVGVFDVNSFNSDMRAEIFTIIYVIIFNIMLLNLLVAILTQVYTTINNKADMLYVNQLVTLYSLYAPHSHYDSIIASYPPLNLLFGIVFFPILLFTSGQTRIRLNKIFLYISYTFTFIIILMVYIGIQCAILPVCYLKIMVHKFILIFIGRDYNHWAKRMGSFFLFMFAGLPMLIPVFFADIYYFTLHSYLHPGEPRFSEASKVPLDRKVFHKLVKFIANAKKTFCVLEWEKLKRVMYDLCSINVNATEKKPTIVGGSGPVEPVKTPKSKYKNYRNYTVVAQMMENVGSKTDKGDIYIDIEILSMLLENYKFMVKMHKTQSRLLNIRMSTISSHTRASIVKAATTYGLQRIPSLVVDDLPEDNPGPDVVYMRLFLTYNLEKFTNALISFKMHVNPHWLAKNTLIMATDAQIVKTLLIPQPKKAERPTKRAHGDSSGSKQQDHSLRASASGSREDSLLMQKGEPRETKIRDSQSVGQELDNILRKIETGPLSPDNFRQSTITVSQAHISVAAKNKSSFFSPMHGDSQ